VHAVLHEALAAVPGAAPAPSTVVRWNSWPVTGPAGIQLSAARSVDR
jgi:hypothetical protein